MFSGIIERVATVRAAEPVDGALRLTLDTGFADLALGESVAVNGVCLTVIEADNHGVAAFFVSPETLSRSNLGVLVAGATVNLERAVTLATRLSGHLVQGHVDGEARLASIQEQGESRLVTFSVPGSLRRFCVEKGSIALNGVSLTLNLLGEVQADGRFDVGVTLIPHTWEQTNFRDCPIGGPINVEVDVIAKYVERLCHAYLPR